MKFFYILKCLQLKYFALQTLFRNDEAEQKYFYKTLNNWEKNEAMQLFPPLSFEKKKR